MAYASPTLLFEDTEPTGLEPRHGTGLLPAQHLKALIEQSREIRATRPIEADQLQPASLDLRLGASRILRSATLDGAEALGFGESLGSLEPGKRAELLGVAVPPDVVDVEEYLLGGIDPGRIRWLEAE